MPRRLRTPPKYCLHRKSGLAYVFLVGKRRYLGKYGTPVSREKYDQFVAAWRADGESAKADAPAEPKPATLQELQQRFRDGEPVFLAELALVYHQRNQTYYVKAGQVTREVGLIREAALALLCDFPHSRVDAIGPLEIDQFRGRLIGEQSWSRKHLNKQIDRIKRMFRWGVEKAIVTPAVYHAIAAVSALGKGRSEARELPPIKAVSDDVIEKILPHLSNVVRAMVQVQRLTGARPGEVCAIRPCDIVRPVRPANKKTIVAEVWEYRPATHKTEDYGHERVIAIGPRAQKILNPFLDGDHEAYCFSPEDAVGEERTRRSQARRTPRQTGNRPGTNRKAQPHRVAGAQYTTGSYRRAIHRACDRAFPPPASLTAEEKRAWKKKHHWCPNQLRHSAATHVRDMFGLDASQAILGHTSARTTEIYAELNRGRAAEVAASLG